MRTKPIWLLIVLAMLLPDWVMGQNLILNGSFETYRTCPRLDNLLEEATPWYNPNRATPDFYHQCFPTGQAVLPPHSGQGMGRLFFDQGWSEYMGIQLIKPLVAEKCYYFEMYIATETPSKYLTATIGAYFSNQAITSTTTDRFNVGPQIVDNQPANAIARLQWQRISGIVKARGGEDYVTIGSFYKSPPFLGFYYLFVDDVSLVPVDLELGKDTTLCGRKSTLLLDGTTPGASYYRWQDGSTTPTLLVTRPGKYSVTVTTPCTTLTDSITVDYALDFSLGNDTTLCQGQTLVLNAPPAKFATYQWQDNSQKNTFAVGQAGQYSVQVRQAGCVVADTIQVRYVKPPTLELGPDQELCGAQIFTIKPTITEGKFSWQDAFADVQRTVNSSGVFRASVQNDCATITDSVRIDYGACDCVLYAPTGFTPNNDGLNDVFLAYGCGDITITSLAIFNRWGEVIFETSTLPFQWDGYYRGSLCPADVYAWRIQYQLNQRGQVKRSQQRGTLMLVR